MPGRHLLAPAVLLTGLLVPCVSTEACTDTFADQLHRLRVCESRDNYRATTGIGYFAVYQYAQQTWRNHGYATRPDRASARTQDGATTKLYARCGWSAWPGCARREH